MAVTLSQQDYWDLICSEAEPIQDTSLSDCTWKYCDEVGKGCYREIQIRDGIELAIAEDYFHERLNSENCSLPPLLPPASVADSFSGGGSSG